MFRWLVWKKTDLLDLLMGYFHYFFNAGVVWEILVVLGGIITYIFCNIYKILVKMLQTSFWSETILSFSHKITLFPPSEPLLDKKRLDGGPKVLWFRAFCTAFVEIDIHRLFLSFCHKISLFPIMVPVQRGSALFIFVEKHVLFINSTTQFTIHVVWLFSSPEPKAHGWANSIPVTPSSVRRPSVRLSVRPSTFSNIFSSETTGPIKLKFHMETP